MNQFVQIRRELHQIPELGFREFKTQQYLLDYLKALPADRLEVETWRTGIFVLVKGKNPSKTIGYRTDIDGLPVTEQTALSFSSLHEGQMHACGHDFHMSIALGILTEIVHQPIDDNCLFLFQPAEEGPGGAKEMIATDLFQRWRPDQLMALHIAPDYPVGTIVTKSGTLFANTSELFIDFHGLGGHAAMPHKTKDMLVVCAQFVNQIQTIIARNMNPMDAAVITFGKMEAGTASNVIADSARLEGTIRTLSAEAMEKVKQRIEAFVAGFQISFDCKMTLDYGSGYYQVSNDEALTNEFIDFVHSQTGYGMLVDGQTMAGEDFGFMLQEVPGFMFWLGVGSDYGLHHAKLNPDEAAIGEAIRLVADYIRYQSEKV